MTWIQVIQPHQATGELADYYRDREYLGRRVSNVQKAISINPSAMAALDKLQESFEERGALSAVAWQTLWELNWTKGESISHCWRKLNTEWSRLGFSSSPASDFHDHE